MEFETKLNYGKTLKNFVFKTIEGLNEGLCRTHCYIEDRCLSYNHISDKNTCELSESDHVMNPNNLVARPGGIYSSVEVQVNLI